MNRSTLLSLGMALALMGVAACKSSDEATASTATDAATTTTSESGDDTDTTDTPTPTPDPAPAPDTNDDGDDVDADDEADGDDEAGDDAGDDVDENAGDDDGDDADNDGTDGDGDADEGGAADTTAPTVTVKTSDDRELSSETSASVTTDTSFTATFSEAVVPAGVTTEGVTLTCDEGDGAVGRSITVAAAEDSGDGIADNEFTITPDTELPGDTVCTLGFNSEVAAIVDAAGNAVAATTFTVSTCGTSDNFGNEDSLAVCWTAAADNPGKLATSNADGVETFTIAADLATAGLKLGYTKGFSDGDLTVNATITGITGLTAAAGQSGASDSVSVQLVGSDDTAGNKTVFCGVSGNDGNGITVMFFAGTPGQENPPATATIGSGDGIDTTLLLTLTKTGNDFDCTYTFDNGETTAVGDTETLDIGATYTGGLSFSNVAGDDPLTALLDAVEFIAGDD